MPPGARCRFERHVDTAWPGSPSADALNLLASWAATQDEATAAQPDRAPHQA